MDAKPELCFAYYCSGHGYGHATRVSAFACHLLSLEHPPIVYIVSSAPKHVFAASVALGARYRYADIDPVITQPLAYRVDRRKSVDVLESFLVKKEAKVVQEARWLSEVQADCVLSDAAFLAFLAADRVRLPSILITNFTFDSIYSLLSATFVDQSRAHILGGLDRLSESSTLLPLPEPDIPIPEDIMAPLVQQIFDGYRRADLLLRLPGAIPIPSFSIEPALPAPDWIDPNARSFKIDVVAHLIQDPKTYTVHPSIPFSTSDTAQKPRPKHIPRFSASAPMLVRLPSDDVYTPAGRARVLSSIGVPYHQHDPLKTKILVVSFGGQIFHRPSSSRSPSRPGTAASSPMPSPSKRSKLRSHHNNFSGELAQSLHKLALTSASPSPSPARPPRVPPPIFSPSHINIPGAPSPAAMPSPSAIFTGFSAFPTCSSIPTFNTIPPSPIVPDMNGFGESHLVGVGESTMEPEEGDPGLMLPDASWIAIVCGVADSKEWRPRRHTPGEDEHVEDGTNPPADDDELPEGFYIAPRDVYMPDLMAVGDVLLGKLGYGTVSECVDSCTPFVYVSRPLFVEEHGLRLYLSREGVGVEMEREQYEAGDWAASVAEAWRQGEQRKLERRAGMHAVDRKGEGGKMASFVTNWVHKWTQAAKEE